MCCYLQFYREHLFHISFIVSYFVGVLILKFTGFLLFFSPLYLGFIWKFFIPTETKFRGYIGVSLSVGRSVGRSVGPYHGFRSIT